MCSRRDTLRLHQSARYLTFDRRITECWSQLGAAVRTAQVRHTFRCEWFRLMGMEALGLHRDASTMVRGSFDT